MGKIVLSVSPRDEKTISRMFPSFEFYSVASVSHLQSLLIEQNDILLVIMDLKALGVEENSFRELIRSRSLNLPILILADDEEKLEKDLSFDFGMIDFIGKPFDKWILNEKIEVCLRMRTVMLIFEKDRSLRKNKRPNANGNFFQESTINELMDLLETNNDNLMVHLRRTSRMMRILGSKVQSLHLAGYGISSKELERMVIAAPLHDIGKICIPKSILDKPGKLTAEEFNLVKQHVLYGVAILQFPKDDVPEFLETMKMAKVIICGHHERYDGSGYPYGIKGRDIPLAGRMMAVIDVYDALTNERPYKHAMRHEEAMEYLKANSGSHFDPVITDVFVSVQDQILLLSVQ